MLDSLLQAARPALGAAFTLWGSPVTWLEIVAFVLGIWMVLCNLRVNALAWPLAIVSSLLYALLFADSRLYGQVGLQLVFVAAAFWGWWQWLRGTDASGQRLHVRSLSVRGRWLALAAAAVLWPLLALLLMRSTDSDVPVLDALPTAGSLVGQVLLARKFVENWLVWVGVNLVSIALFASQSLWLTVLLYAVFTLLAVAGWRAWRRIERGVPA